MGFHIFTNLSSRHLMPHYLLSLESVLKKLRKEQNTKKSLYQNTTQLRRMGKWKKDFTYSKSQS
jgi:hypothetical protein